MGRAKGLTVAVATSSRGTAAQDTRFGGPVPAAVWRTWPLADAQVRKLEAVARTEQAVNVLAFDKQTLRVVFTVPPRFDKRGHYKDTRRGSVGPHGDTRWT